MDPIHPIVPSDPRLRIGSALPSSPVMREARREADRERRASSRHDPGPGGGGAAGDESGEWDERDENSPEESRPGEAALDDAALETKETVGHIDISA